MQVNSESKQESLLHIFATAILAGMFIGIGGVAWVLCESKYVGAALFCVGLFTICQNQLWLFTGKIGYLVEQPNKPYLYRLILTWVGNFIGATLLAAIAATANGQIKELSCKIVQNRLIQSAPKTITLSILCGMLMFIAVDAFKNHSTIAGIMLGIPTFLLCGFEHCIADMFFFASWHIASWEAIAHIVCVTLGNAIGSIIVSMVVKRSD